MTFSLFDVAFVASLTGGVAYDADALAYITAVEAADAAAGQSGGLETGVKDAINDFVLGCKADGIWSAIKACCILAGARTLDGCLVPLVGAAPTSYNFVAGDYSRETGLVGNGSTKYLDSNRANNADLQDNAHRAVWVANASTIDDANYMGSNGVATVGGDNVFRGSLGQLSGSCRGDGAGAGFSIPGQGGTMGFKGLSRAAALSYTVRTGGSDTTVSLASSTPTSENIAIFARTPSSPAFFSNPRLAFYSIGESLDLALLDARVTALIAAIGVAIP